MDKSSPERKPEGKDGTEPRRTRPNTWLIVVLLSMFVVFAIHGATSPPPEITYEFFKAQLANINTIDIRANEFTGTFKETPAKPFTDRQGNQVALDTNFFLRLPNLISETEKYQLLKDLYSNDVTVRDLGPHDNTSLLLISSVLLPLLLIFFLYFMFRRTRDQFLGGGFLSGFSKSPARKFEGHAKPVTFDDVAGLKNVKTDLQEMVDFLTTPEKFERLGGRVPQGILLMGPPGTGKTLLARAVAGEAGVPFYSVNGSEFIQMFVGVGASRVRDLFNTAKEHSPAIVFIDEIDAVGRQRGAGLGGGHDEREQTLNQILSEMDGFTQADTVIVIAATNRPDVLDPALLRPGRFDRHVNVDRPTQKGRLEIFKVHVREILMADDVDLNRLASGTVGLTGADIRNIVNEAAIWAARHDKQCVEMLDFEFARDKVLMGPKREEVLLDDEKEKTAYHEAGHALLAWITPGPDRVHKVTIMPRGRMLGATEILPEEDRLNISESELHDRIICLLGGRAAEDLVYDEYTAGAENDLERATKLARRMVTQWGMSKRLGPVNYKISDEDPFLGREMHQLREFSEHTMQTIDEEVAKLLHAAEDRAHKLLSANRDKLETLAAGLIEQEELDVAEMTELIGPASGTTSANNLPANGVVAKS